MKQISLILLVSIFTCLGCANKKKENYKYTDKDDLFSCSNVDMVLIKEAVYAFEDFIMKNYSYNSPHTLEKGYKNFLHNATMGLIPKAELFDQHLKDIFNSLKENESLWNISPEHTSLKYDTELINCIGNSINKGTNQNVFKALTESNTMRPKVFSASLYSDVDAVVNDKALGTYIALDMFYAKLFGLDLSLSPIELSKQIAEKNSELAGHHH